MEIMVERRMVVGKIKLAKTSIQSTACCGPESARVDDRFHAVEMRQESLKRPIVL
jgi:hypothetical protein